MTRNLKTVTRLSVIFLCGTTLSNAEEITLRIGSGHPIGLLAYTESAHEWFAPELKRRIEAQTDHTVTVQEFHAGQVAKVTEVLESTRDGILDIGFVSMIFEPSNLALQNFTLYLPFNSPDAAKVTEAARATYAQFPELTAPFEKDFSQVYLGGACLENYGLGTNFAWENFADLEGHKIAGAGVNLDWISGATAVASNLNEAYQSIQSGVYEGYISAASWWHAFKLNEVAPHFTKTDFGAQYLNAVTINKAKYDSLPEDVRGILHEMGEEWAGVTQEICARNDAEGLAKLEELGVEVTEISLEAKTDWANALSAFPDSMAQKVNESGQPGSAVMNFYMESIESLGHEWAHRYVIK
jgi:TRAP-type C4-dicarboxylate transport system substrate-binding protein